MSAAAGENRTLAVGSSAGSVVKIVQERLLAGDLDELASHLVLAAFGGIEVIERVIVDGTLEQGGEVGAVVAPVAAYITSLDVEGFRGIGPTATLPLTPGPGLTLVVGRNGSGKSSFAEALEVLFTGTSQRWVGRAKIWQEGWRNLHQPYPTSITVEAILDGLGDTTVTGTWDAAAPFESLRAQAQPKGKPRTTLDAFGWESALSSYRPFLSYNELSSMLDEGPSKLYDALSLVLGLDALVHAQDALQRDRTDRDKALKAADVLRKQLVEKLKAFLATHADARASTCLAALESRTWDLGAVEAIVNTDV